MERCGQCKNCLELEKHKRVMLHAAQPYSLVNGRLVVDTSPPAFDNELWNKTLQSLPCLPRIPYIKVSQVKAGDILKDTGRLEWKQWEGSDKALTVISKGGVTQKFILTDSQGKEYCATGQRLTSYSHNIVFRNDECVGRFFCKYW